MSTLRIVVYFLIFSSLILTAGNVSAEETGQDANEPAPQEEQADLASQARDPTAPLTAFSIRYDYISDFHNLPGADQQQLVLQPVIPWKWGDSQHIARITAAYITDGPDWALLAPPDEEDYENTLPPGYTPTANKTGLADTALVDVIIKPTSWGRQGFGAGVILPTASDPALGTEKWSIGPAYAAMTKIGKFQGGFLAMWMFSVAGKSDRDNVSSLTIQPFGGFGLKNNWSINMSEMAFNYNLKTSRWTSLPLGFSVEKLIRIGNTPARLFFQYEYNFADNGVAPKNLFRIALVPLL